jgi:hypothetical protein
MYKLYVSYNMKDGKEEDCQRYFSQVLGPTMTRFGANVAEVWYTIWGDVPQVQSGSILDTEEELQRLVNSTKWQEALEGIEPLVDDLNVRTVRVG